MATLETEIRCLEPIALHNLGRILNLSDSWKKLMSIVPKDDKENEYMFTREHFAMIENAIHVQKKSGADIFLTEWSTMGRNRPTCGKMLDLLVKAELFRAADYLAVEVLKRDPPERPRHGPAAPIDVSVERLLKEQAKAMMTTDSVESCSFQFVEKPMNAVVATAAEVSDDEKEKSDLMKFTQDQINLMQSNEIIEKKRLEDLPQNISNFMIFSSDEVKPESTEVRDKQGESFVLEEVKSEFLPVFVRGKVDLQPSKETEISESSSVIDTETTIESSDVSEDTVHSEPSIVQEQQQQPISQGIIPLVVLEFNQREPST